MPGPRLCDTARGGAEPVRAALARGHLPGWGGFARAKKAPLSKGAGRVSGLGDSDGPCLIARYTRRRPGIPPPRLRSAPPFDKGGFLRGRSPQKGAPRSGVTPRCAGRCREATEGFGSEGLAEPARPEGLCRALRYIPSTDPPPANAPRGVGDAAPYSVGRKLSGSHKRARRPEGWPPYKLPFALFVGERFIPPGHLTQPLLPSLKN